MFLSFFLLYLRKNTDQKENIMELKKRSEFPENELWDLTALYQDQEDFLRAIEKTREEINEFVRNYKGKLHTFEDF